MTRFIDYFVAICSQYIRFSLDNHFSSFQTPLWLGQQLSMSIKFACDHCDKRFNLKVQLSKHEISEHPKIPAASKSGGSFDELRSKYLELRTKLHSLDEKFKDLQVKLSEVENRPTTRSSVKDGNPFDVETTKLNKLTETRDEYCPEGWKCYTRPLNESFTLNTAIEIKTFVSPEGCYCPSRVRALRYTLVGHEKFSVEDVELMRRGLLSDGWSTAENCPDGWLIKSDDDGRRTMFVSADYKVLRSIKSALSYLLLRKNDENISNFLLKYALKRDSDRNEVKWKINSLIPFPWRIAEVGKIGESNVEKFYIAPDGSCFAKIRNVIPGIMKDTRLTQLQKDRFQNFIKGRKDKSLTILPTLKKSSKSKLKTKKSQKVITGIRQKRNRLKINPDNYSWLEDDSLPSGWKYATTTNNFSQIVFLDGNGNFFGGIISALKKMLQNKDIFTVEDINNMKNRLLEHGWIKDEILPSDWFLKISRKGDEMFLTQDFVVLKTLENAFVPLKDLGYDDDKINIIKDLVLDLKSRKDKQVRIKVDKPEHDDSDWSPGDETVPLGWKMKINQSLNIQQYLFNDKIFTSRVEALFYMMKHQDRFAEVEITELREKLNHEFWEEHALLPEHWRYQRVVGGVVVFLTSMGRVVRTVKGAKDNLKLKHDKLARENFEKFLRIFKPVNREHKGEGVAILAQQDQDEEIMWNSSKDLPPDWSLAITVEGERIKDSSGNIYKSRKDAIDHMIKEKFPPSDIFKLWSTLHIEGWLEHKLLPTGWKRKYYSSDSTFQFLSPMMEMFTSVQHLKDHFKQQPEQYSEQDLENVELLKD